MAHDGKKTWSIVLVAVALVGSRAARAADEPILAPSGDGGVSANFDTGVRLQDVGGSREKFEEYGSVGEGFVIDELQLRLRRGGADFLELGVRNAMRDDEAYRISVGRRGRYRLDLDYAGIPHRYASGIFLWGGFGTQNLQIPDSVQAQLQANEQTAAERSGGTTTSSVNPNLDTTGEDAVQQSIVRGLQAAADPVSFQLRRRRAGAGLTFALGKDADAWVRVSNENQRGTRVISAGSYERWNVGSGLTHVEDRFIVQGQDLAEPIAQRTFSATAGVGVQKRGWDADVEYTFTQFRNFNDALLWDNPFRLTNAAQTTGGFDRGRSAIGQIVLPPHSLSHDATVSARADLPLQGQLAATASYGIVTQDEPFLPYTRNTAIQPTPAVPDSPNAAELARPARDLGGDVRTIAGTLSLALRPLHMLGLGARYRVYRYDAKTPEITFPGYAAFGESGWRTMKNDKNAPVVNEVFDYTRQDAGLSADLHLARFVTLTVEGDWERWNFDHLRVDDMREYGAAAGILVRPPIRATSIRLSYRYADRKISDYLKGRTAGNPEGTGLINYNWSDRTRNQVEARVQHAPTRRLSLGLVGRFVNDDHGGETEGGTVVDQFRFGRRSARSLFGGADASFNASDRLGVHVGYSREHRKERMKSAAKDDGPKSTAIFGFEDDYSPVNYWNSDVVEDVNTVSLGANVQILPELLLLAAGYDLSFGEIDVNTSNPNGVQPTTLANAVAKDWPTIRNRLHEITADLSIPFSPNVRAGARYLFAWYDLDDFAWDTLDPYMAGRTVENSTRFVFADATYEGYRAHVGTLYVSGRF